MYLAIWLSFFQRSSPVARSMVCSLVRLHVTPLPHRLPIQRAGRQDQAPRLQLVRLVDKVEERGALIQPHVTGDIGGWTRGAAWLGRIADRPRLQNPQAPPPLRPIAFARHCPDAQRQGNRYGWVSSGGLSRSDVARESGAEPARELHVAAGCRRSRGMMDGTRGGVFVRYCLFGILSARHAPARRYTNGSAFALAPVIPA